LGEEVEGPAAGVGTAMETGMWAVDPRLERLGGGDADAVKTNNNIDAGMAANSASVEQVRAMSSAMTATAGESGHDTNGATMNDTNMT